MGLVYPSLPTVGEPNSTEQPKVRQSLVDLRDTINGDLDNANIASGANINGAKLLAQSVGSTQVKVVMHSATGTVTGTADHTWASQANVVPGYYLATGYVDITSGPTDLRFTNSGGTVSTLVNGTLSTGSYAVSAVIVVTATTTILLRGTWAAGGGAQGGFTLFGIGA